MTSRFLLLGCLLLSACGRPTPEGMVAVGVTLGSEGSDPLDLSRWMTPGLQVSAAMAACNVPFSEIQVRGPGLNPPLIKNFPFQVDQSFLSGGPINVLMPGPPPETVLFVPAGPDRRFSLIGGVHDVLSCNNVANRALPIVGDFHVQLLDKPMEINMHAKIYKSSSADYGFNVVKTGAPNLSQTPFKVVDVNWGGVPGPCAGAVDFVQLRHKRSGFVMREINGGPLSPGAALNQMVGVWPEQLIDVELHCGAALQKSFEYFVTGAPNQLADCNTNVTCI